MAAISAITLWYFPGQVARFCRRHGPSRTLRLVTSYSRLRKDIGGRIADTVGKYRIPDPGTTPQKYLDHEYWLLVALERVFRLGLHDGPPRRILDLGTGAGYFPYACRFFGHEVEVLDAPGNDMYAELTGRLELRRHTHYIERFRDLDVPGTFDLITAFMICFNRHKQPDVWHVNEWRYFLASARRHQLRPGGTIFLQLNRESVESPVHPELLDFFRSIGAEIEGREIEIRAECIVAVD